MRLFALQDTTVTEKLILKHRINKILHYKQHYNLYSSVNVLRINKTLKRERERERRLGKNREGKK
jgi:hypothetical protein